MEKHNGYNNFSRKLASARALVRQVHILPRVLSPVSEHFQEREAQDEVLPPPDYYDSRGYPQWTLADQLEQPGSIQPELWEHIGEMTLIVHPTLAEQNRWDSGGTYFDGTASWTRSYRF
jgi:hypothetical protein